MASSRAVELLQQSDGVMVNEGVNLDAAVHFFCYLLEAVSQQKNAELRASPDFKHLKFGKQRRRTL